MWRAGQGVGGITDFFSGEGGVDAAGGQGLFAHATEKPADVGLEENDDNEHKALDDDIQEPFQGEKLQLAGHQIGDKQEEEPGQDLDGLGAAQHQHHLVNDDGHQDDVHTILPAQIA